MGQNFRVGTRASPLALKQVEEILYVLEKTYPSTEIEVVRIDTYGDSDKDTPISEIEGSDFFTREIDEALINGDIDFAVHSAKDLPDNLVLELFVAAITKSIDPFDALVAKDNLELHELKKGAKIGTSSLRRKTQLKDFRKDFQLMDIRGNIEERLKLLSETDLDAIVIASIGLMRLGLECRIAQRIPFEILKPHPLQGCLAVVTRANDKNLIDLISILDSKEVVFV